MIVITRGGREDKVSVSMYRISHGRSQGMPRNLNVAQDLLTSVRYASEPSFGWIFLDYEIEGSDCIG